jgi:SAM-dependent methyltransferase
VSSSQQRYALATGGAAATRLELLDQIFGPASRMLLERAGLASGWRVAEIGCGIGLMTLWMAESVGPSGSVCTVDMSEEQLRVAANRAAAAGLTNVVFHQASACETGLPRASFDLVYSRFLLCHLPDPLKAVREMSALLKPGGVLVCEDFDANSIAAEPPARAYQRLVEISDALDAHLGVDSNVGLKLHRFFREAGFEAPEVAISQPAALRGNPKRFWELTLREAAPAILEAGVASEEELSSICDEMQAIARDESTLILIARVSQVWARRAMALDSNE